MNSLDVLMSKYGKSWKKFAMKDRHDRHGQWWIDAEEVSKSLLSKPRFIIMELGNEYTGFQNHGKVRILIQKGEHSRVYRVTRNEAVTILDSNSGKVYFPATFVVNAFQSYTNEMPTSLSDIKIPSRGLTEVIAPLIYFGLMKDAQLAIRSSRVGTYVGYFGGRCKLIVFDKKKIWFSMVSESELHDCEEMGYNFPFGKPKNGKKVPALYDLVASPAVQTA